MSALSDKGHSSETTQVLLLIYNPETGKWLNAGSQMYDGAQNTLEFKVDFGELFSREEVGGESYICRPFWGCLNSNWLARTILISQEAVV